MHHTRVETAFVVMVVLLVIETVAFVYLANSNYHLCQEVKTLGNGVISARAGIDNVTSGLLVQIASDQSLVGTLNSSRPQGYQNMITALQDQITTDEAMIATLNQLIPVSDGLHAGSVGLCP
jgi:hypothetical protein